MRLIILPIIASLLAGCATSPQPQAMTPKPSVTISDPIDQLVADFEAEYHSGRNTPISEALVTLGLPKTASPEQVIKRTFETSYVDSHLLTNYTILQIRQIQIPHISPSGFAGDLYTAAVVQTDFGKKIVLFQYVGVKFGLPNGLDKIFKSSLPETALDWWSKVYTVKPSA
jgi:hypothetical protein